MRLYPPPLSNVPQHVAASLTGGGGAVQATHWSQASAANAKFLTAPDAAWETSGTIVAVINPTAIGSSWGGILYLQGPAGYSIWLAIGPGTPDFLRSNITHASVVSTCSANAPSGDSALYDGTPKVAWMHYAAGGTQRVGWGKPSDGNTSSTTSRPVTARTGVTASVANLVGANGSLGGEYEVAMFDRVLSDAELDSIVDAGTIAGVTSGRTLYPVPAPGVVGAPPTVLSSPSTQIADDTAHTWSLSTVDGTSDIQAVR